MTPTLFAQAAVGGLMQAVVNSVIHGGPARLALDRAVDQIVAPACLTCCKRVTVCECLDKQARSTSQVVTDAVLDMGEVFREYVAQMSDGERVQTLRALANLVRPYSAEAADELASYGAHHALTSSNVAP